jgi:hypothetical protein
MLNVNKDQLTNIMFVGIDLGTDEDEQQISDTINSLGVKLTTAERRIAGVCSKRQSSLVNFCDDRK